MGFENWEVRFRKKYGLGNGIDTPLQDTPDNFVIYDVETHTSGKTAEICQLSAVDQSALFQRLYIGFVDVDFHATRVNQFGLIDFGCHSG